MQGIVILYAFLVEGRKKIVVTKSYKHLNYEDRKSIEKYLKEGLSVVKIAEKLKVHRSTVYNEIKRAGVSTENKNAYSADVAQHAM